VIAAQGVEKRYGALAAVAGVTFEVRPGECYGLLGPNGAGKSTLFKLLTAAVRRTAGTLSVFGFDPATHPREVKARLGVVQQEDTLDGDLDVLANLRVWGGYYGLDPATIASRSAALLDFLALGEKLHVPIMALSGGMKRRLTIARALLSDPQLLLLDEPTTGLDPQVRHAIWEALRLLKGQGMTILLTTHYMEEASQLADRVGILDGGRLAAEDAPAALVKQRLPRWVLELPVSAQAGDGWRGLQGARVEVHGDRGSLFHDDEGALRRWLDAQAITGALLRPASLEDVFLELTGRRLDG